MNDFTYAWLIMASITLVMFLAQAAIAEENPEGQVYLNGTNPISRYYTGGEFDDSDPRSNLPNAGSGESAQNDYTDEYRVTQSWFGNAIGNNYVGDALSMPFNIMKSMGLPNTVANIFGAFWFGLLILITALMILGKER